MQDDEEFALDARYAKENYIESLEQLMDERIAMGAKDPHSHILLMFRLKKLDPSYRDGTKINVTQAAQVNTDIDARKERIRQKVEKIREIYGIETMIRRMREVEGTDLPE